MSDPGSVDRAEILDRSRRLCAESRGLCAAARRLIADSCELMRAGAARVAGRPLDPEGPRR